MDFRAEIDALVLADQLETAHAESLLRARRRQVRVGDIEPFEQAHQNAVLEKEAALERFKEKMQEWARVELEKIFTAEIKEQIALNAVKAFEVEVLKQARAEVRRQLGDEKKKGRVIDVIYRNLTDEELQRIEALRNKKTSKEIDAVVEKVEKFYSKPPIEVVK